MAADTINAISDIRPSDMSATLTHKRPARRLRRRLGSRVVNDVVMDPRGCCGIDSNFGSAWRTVEVPTALVYALVVTDAVLRSNDGGLLRMGAFPPGPASPGDHDSWSDSCL